MSRFLRLSRSTYSRSLIIRLANATLAFGVSILLARLLGPHHYGIYGLLLSTATLVAIPLTTGLPRAISRDLAQARVQDDPGRMRQIIRHGQISFVAIALPLILSAAAAWKLGVNVGKIDNGILFVALLAPFLAADANRVAIMQGLGEAIRSQIPDLLVRPLGTAGFVVALLVFWHHTSAVVAVFAYATATLFGLLVGSSMVRTTMKAYPRMGARISHSWPPFIYAIATLSILGGAKIVTGNLDLLLVGHLLTLAEVGYYKVALAGLAVVVLGTNAITHVAYTRFAEAVPRRDLVGLCRESDRAITWSLITTITVVVAIVVCGLPLIKIAYGSAYLQSWPVLIVLSLGFTFALLFGPGDMLLMLSGQQLWAAGAIAIGIAVTLSTALPLAHMWGAVGVALASALGTVLRFGLIALLVYREFHVDITILGWMRRRAGRNA